MIPSGLRTPRTFSCSYYTCARSAEKAHQRPIKRANLQELCQRVGILLPDCRRGAMQALKDVLEGGSPTVAWSVVQAALSEQEQQRRLEISASGDPEAAPGSLPHSPPHELRSGAEHLLQRDSPRVILDSATLWRQFFSATNEMIVTKAGR